MSGAAFVDLEQDGLDSFRGRLAIILGGPDPAVDRPGARANGSLIGKGINLVWSRPTTKLGLASKGHPRVFP